MFHCICVPHLYLFIRSWASRLLPCLAYCQQCYSEHWGACILWAMFLSIYMPRRGITGSCGNSVFSFLRSLHTVLYSGYEVKWKSLSRVRLFVTPWTLQSMEFSRPEYWDGWPFPSPGDLPNPVIETQVSRIAVRFFTSWATREAHSGCTDLHFDQHSLHTLSSIYCL